MLKKLTFKLGMKWNGHGANHFAKAEAAEKNHNEAEALAAYELAAKNGHAKAQYRLAQRYFLGLGVKKIMRKRLFGTKKQRNKAMRKPNSVWA
jgi:TPR repeat protein